MDFEELLVSEEITILQAMEKLDRSAKKILLVERDRELLGTVTDGDIRRWILGKGDLDGSINEVMNTSPITLNVSKSHEAYELMKEKKVEAIPIVDEKKNIVSISFWNMKDEVKSKEKFNVPVVIMAGGKGTRLYPYTKILPKPLIPIGDVPIVERIIDNFKEFGCQKFYMTINHKKNMIMSYFNEIDKDYDLTYIEEEKPLGTGGSLSLIKERVKETFFVSNCDTLLNADYVDIFKFHKGQKNKITMVASLRETVIPYGVITLNDEGHMEKITEKPIYNHLINTGVYVIEPDLLHLIPENMSYNLPDLAKRCIENNEKVGVYPVSQCSWLDMGQLKEMENMLHQLRVK